MAGGTNAGTQRCETFNYVDWRANTFNGPENSYYACAISGNLQNDEEEVTTDTSGNRKSNDEVPAVYYYANNM